jgi:hypothetical protein
MKTIHLLIRVLCSAVVLMEFGYSHQVRAVDFQFGGGL